MNARQQAEYRDELARRRIALHPPGRARPRKRRITPTPPLPPRSEPRLEPRSPDEATLADRLFAHICAESVIDRRAHAVGVARMIQTGRLR